MEKNTDKKTKTKRRDPNYMKVYMFGKKYDWPYLDYVYYPRHWGDAEKLLYEDMLSQRGKL